MVATRWLHELTFRSFRVAMPRPKKDAKIDLGAAQELTAGLIKRLPCPVDRGQSFLRDTKAPGLRVRVTKAGAKSFVFEAKLNGQTIRRTIGDVRAWSIDAARNEANRLRVTLDEGNDPRELERQAQAAKASAMAAAAEKLEANKMAAITVREVWDIYLADRRPRWGELHYKDHVKLARAGGVPARRGTDGRGVTIDMPLHALMGLALRDLTAPVIEDWAIREAGTRPTSARLAWRLLKGFLGWCGERPEFAGLLPATNPANTNRAREALGRAGVKQDALLREQLPAWFAAVQQIQNPVISAALQTMLFTGARPGEVLSLRWNDVNTKWWGLTIRDKVDGERIIPLTPYVWHLLAGLPRRNELIFSSATAQAGALTAPRKHHVGVCKVAGIENLTLHGLRRSFKSLTEWLEVPVGVVAQIMGHKPSATAEKHYTVRPLDLLRGHHERIEAWMLEQAGIAFDAAVEQNNLRLVTAN
jgi:integrase